MGVLRTNEDTFEEQANVNSYVTDQHYSFSIPTKGSSSYFPVIPKNYAYSQIIEKDLVHTINSEDTDQGIIQVFQAKDINNISGFKFLAQASHNATEQRILLDAFEYTTNDEITAVWKSSNTENSHDDGIVITTNWWNEYDGLYCLEASVWAHAEGNYFEMDITEGDWETVSEINFNWMSSKDDSDYRWELQVIDNQNQQAKIEFSADDKWEWDEFSFKRELFSNTEIIDWSNIVKLRFYCKEVDSYFDSYMDNLYIIKNTKNTKVRTKVSLIHFGTDPDFSTLGDKKTLDNNFDYEDVVLDITSKRINSCNLQYGATNNNWKLVKDDYYGIMIHKPEEGNINIYGSNTQTFTDGNLYDVADSGDLTALNKSLSFMICTFSESSLKNITIRQNTHSPRSTINLLLIDPVTFKVNQFLGVYSFDTNAEINIEYDYSKPEIIKTDSENHLYVYYQDDYKSESTKLIVNSRFHYSTGV